MAQPGFLAFEVDLRVDDDRRCFTAPVVHTTAVSGSKFTPWQRIWSRHRY
ncbi:hypothetical protein MOTT12_00940 [Mycobacterium intracellulare subsp. yongonense]|nr:hypothetical protein MOTT12_00940 [Mycobacterium intracellulare subsp. yongonense]